MAKIKREELSGKFLEAFDKIVKLKNSKDSKEREAGLKGEKTLEKLLSSEKGKAVKKEVKPKATPKAKATPKSKAKPKAKPKAKTKTSTTPKVLPFSTRASNLMKKEGLSWADAKAKLSKEIKDEKDKVEAKLKADKKQALNELEKLTKAPEFQKALSQYPKKGGGKKRAIKTTLSNDGKRQALPRGKRVSKNGKTYYEYRDNRSDVNSLPAPKGQYRYKGSTPPYLESGGAIDSLKRDMNSKLDIHSEYYAKGGSIEVNKNEKIIPLNEVRKNPKLKREFLDGLYLAVFEKGKKTAIGVIKTPKELIDGRHLGNVFATILKNGKIKIQFGKEYYAKGGRTISIVNDGVTFDKSKYKAVYGDFDNDGTVNIDDANPLDKTKTGQVEQVELRKTFDKLLGVKAELDEIMYDAVETLDEKAPEGADIYARTKTPYSILKKLVEKRMLDPKRGLTDMIGTTIAVDNQKELEEVRDKIDGGLLGKVLDRDDFYKTPNAGYRAYHYIVEYKGVPVEVQLKTKNMKKLHEVSHEAYKNGNLDAKSLDSVSKTFMRADKGDAKAKSEISKLLSDKKLLSSKVSKSTMAYGGAVDYRGYVTNDVVEDMVRDKGLNVSIQENWLNGYEIFGQKTELDKVKSLLNEYNIKSNFRKYGYSYILKVPSQIIEYAKGGKIGFDGLAKKVAKKYEGTRVPTEYQEQYGKTYNKKEAMEVGKKVAGKVYRQQQSMEKGGTTKQGYDYVPQEAIDELSYTMGKVSKSVSGSNVLSGAYVKSGAKAKTKSKGANDLTKRLLAMTDDEDKTKVILEKDVKEMQKYVSDKLIIAFYLGLPKAYDFKGDYSYGGGIINYDLNRLKKRVADTLKNIKGNKFEMGLKYPQYDFEKLLGKPIIKDVFGKTTTFNDGSTEKYKYRLWIWKDCVIGQTIGSDSSRRGGYTDYTYGEEPTLIGGYKSVQTSKASKLESIAKFMADDKNGFVKDNDVLYNGLGGTTFETLDKNKIKYEAGGTLPTPFGQAGLVGETGAMNEMDMFAMGGGLPQGVHQYYANTYNPAYPTPHGYAKGGYLEGKTYYIVNYYSSVSDIPNGIALKNKSFGTKEDANTFLKSIESKGGRGFVTDFKKPTRDEISKLDRDRNENYMMAKGGEVEGGAFDLSLREKSAMYKYLDKGDFTEEKFMKMFDKNEPQTADIIYYWAESRGLNTPQSRRLHKSSMKQMGYAKGGEIKSVAKAIYEPNEQFGGIKTSRGKKTLKGLENMIDENDAYDVYVALESNFEVQPKGSPKIATTYGDKTMKGLIAMIENSKGSYAKGGKTKRSKHSLMQDRRRVSSESWEVAYQKRKSKMEAGGTLPTPFGQAGLVGETGTLNEMDMFAMGGGLPQGVHQYYANTYNPAYPTPHGYAKGGEIKKYIIVRGTKDSEKYYYQKGSNENNYKWLSSKKGATIFTDIKEAEKSADESDGDIVSLTTYAKGGETQGYNDKLDESLGNTKGKRSTKEQNYKDRRNESEAMEKKGGKRKYASVKTMDKGNRKKRQTPMSLAKEIRKEGEKWQDAVKRASAMLKKK